MQLCSQMQPAAPQLQPAHLLISQQPCSSLQHVPGRFNPALRARPPSTVEVKHYCRMMAALSVWARLLLPLVQHCCVRMPLHALIEVQDCPSFRCVPEVVTTHASAVCFALNC